MIKNRVSSPTSRNWWIDFSLFSSALVAALSGIYFLFMPAGGYQGGRNPYYDLQILFSRQTWDDFHTWGGVAMIAAVVVHLVLHWKWVVSMTRRMFQGIFHRKSGMNDRARYNLVLNIMTGLSFMITAISGVYFLFYPGGRWAVDPQLLFARSTWDLVHTWAGVFLVASAVLHFAIHWKWVTKVTGNLLSNSRKSPAVSLETVAVNS
jgi:hypothetical protein